MNRPLVIFLAGAGVYYLYLRAFRHIITGNPLAPRYAEVASMA